MTKKKRKSRAIWLTIELPSNDLDYEQCGDHETEQHVEYVTGMDDYKYEPTDMRFEMNHPEALRLDKDKIRDIIWDCLDNSKLVETMHSYHTEAVDQIASEVLGFDLDLSHVSGDAAEIKLSVAKRLLACARRDKFESFSTIWGEEAGWSCRDKDPRMWALCEQLTNWDADQRGWLLSAALQVGVEAKLPLSKFELEMRKAAGLATTRWVPSLSNQEFNEKVSYLMEEDDGEYQAWSNAIDWGKYEEKVKEARADLADELPPEQRDLGQFPYRRCPLTLELPLVA